MTLSIDTDAPPPILPARVWVWHRKSGRFLFDPTSVTLWLPSEQKEETGIKGIRLQKEVEVHRPMNGAVLKSLLRNQDEIPFEWKSLRPCFWGTRYKNLKGNLVIPYLSFIEEKDEWQCHTKLVGDMFTSEYPALVASPLELNTK